MHDLLEDITVIDLTQVVSGAVTTMLMGEFGASVIKVEPPEGEPYRRAGYPVQANGEETNLNIMRFSRGKKSIILDLKDPRGREALSRLIRRGDVLVENFRPGVLARLGFPPEEISRLNPAMIYATVTGFGHDDLLPSPHRDRPAYALIAEAMAGLTHLAGDGDGPPVWMGFAMADIFAGSLALSGILLALRDRDRTGRGRRVDVAMYDGALLMNDLAIASYSVLGEVMGRGAYSLQAPWSAFRTTDGYAVIAVLTERQWQSLCEVIGRPDLSADARYASGRARSAHNEAVIAPAITAWTASRTKDECANELLRHSVPAAPVNTAADVFSCRQAEAREMLAEVGDPVLGEVRLAGNPIKLDQRPSAPQRRIPRLGEHTEEVLAELGMSGEESKVAGVGAGDGRGRDRPPDHRGGVQDAGP